MTADPLTTRIAVAIHGATPPNPDAALALHRAQAERVLPVVEAEVARLRAEVEAELQAWGGEQFPGVVSFYSRVRAALATAREPKTQGVLVDLTDERRGAKPWLPTDDRDVTGGRVVPDSDDFGGKPCCRQHGAMACIAPPEADGLRLYRCSECGVGAQWQPAALATAEEPGA